MGLHDVGLIKGVKCFGDYVFRELTQKGIDFIDDYEAQVNADKKQAKDQRMHDYKVASYGAAAGGVLGILGGVLSSWLLDIIGGIAG